jgi:chromosome segregation ATPase
MGIFDRFFKKKEEIEEYIISIDQAPKWYDKQIEPKKDRLKHKIKQAKQKIIQNTQEVKHKLEKLQESGLMNPNIPERAKHFLQGNKEAYTKKVNSFLDALILPEEVEELKGFFQDFNIQIQNLAQGIARPIQILNEFLANETREVSLPLGNIEKEIQKLKDSVEKLKLNEIDETKAKITEIQNKIEKENELKIELNTLITEINKTKRENEQLSTQIELLQKDKELNQAKEEKNQINEKIKQMQKELIESFSIIETALKKYEHITFQHKELIGGYLKSPVQALMKDLHLDVIKMLSDLKSSAEAGKLEMKPRKTKKTLDEIKTLTKERLGKFLTEYGQLHLQERTLQEKIDKMDVVLVSAEKEKKKEKNTIKLNDSMSKMNYLQTELGKIDISLMIKELTSILEEKCYVKLTISATPLVQAAPEQEQ